MKDYAKYDALGLAELIRTGQVKASEVLDAALTRAEAAQTELNCFTALFPEIARDQIKKGLPAGPLSGVPYATKDLAVEIKGAPLTNGSRAWRGNIAKRDSTLVTRYRENGLTLFGQTNSPEFGLTTTTESALYGETRNPWNTERTPGGSSGGAGAAVAAGVIPMAQASDGGGSIRIPASCNGLVGMKPSRGRIPMGPGRTENWLGCSTVHAVSRTVRDNAALMDATHGRESGSRYVAPHPAGTFLSALSENPKPLKIAVWETAPNGTTPDADAQAGIDRTIKLLTDLGHHVEAAAPDLDGAALSKAHLMTISGSIAAVFDDRADVLDRPLGEDDLEMVTRRMYEFGKTVPMSEMARANAAAQMAAIVYEQFLDAGNYDFILAPTTARKPEKLGVMSLNPADLDAFGEAVASFSPWCSVFNQTGAPAISVPLHWTDDGLPIGMMFGGRYGAERELYQLAGQLEKAAPWIDRKPPVWVG